MQMEERVIRRVTLRLLPFLVLCYFVSYLDRSNLGIAALTMNRALGISAQEYGFAAGIFFLGYIICEIPSNLLLVRFGARKWIARIMITWGLVAASMALVNSAQGLYITRILLGIAEAGFFPGVIFYLTLWFPTTYRARIYGYFYLAIPLTIVVGAPLSASLLYLDGVAGFAGWQWLFLVESIPAVILGIVCFYYLTDTPEKATWLAHDERTWLTERLGRDAEQGESGKPSTMLMALTHPKLWLMSVVSLSLTACAYGIVFFLPQIVSEFGFSKIETGFITAMPFLAGAIGMSLSGWSSDRTGERRLHLAIPSLIAAVGYLLAANVHGALPKLLFLGLAAFGTFAAYSPFWTFLPMFVKKRSAVAASIAVINTVGSMAGFGAPFAMGYVKQHTGNYDLALLLIAGLAMLAAIIAYTFPKGQEVRESAINMKPTRS